jgi:D-alanyl-D-alanine carboxypeptidase (penicillin-binding protein 5/6)
VLGAFALVLVPCFVAYMGATAQGRPAARLAAPPALEAAESLLVESDTGQTVYSHLAQREVAIASTTKMMTAYVTLQHEASLRKLLVEQDYDAGYGESLAGFVPGVHYTVKAMLEGMLLPSGNDAAYSLAVDVGGSVPAFVAEMNADAKALGLTETHYATPVGLDTPGNYSSARDLAKLAGVLMGDPAFARIVREPSATVRGGIYLRNRNALVGAYPFVVGVKTGHTGDAGWCLVGAASLHGVHLISVVLGDPTEQQSFDDTLALLRYGLSLYHRAVVAVAGRTYATVAVAGGGEEPLVAEQAGSVVVEHGARFVVTITGVPAQIQGPLPAGTQEGEIVVTVNGHQRLSVPLVTRDAVPDVGS